MPPPTTARPWRAGVPQRGEDPDRVIRELYASPAGWTMFQLQDLLGLGDEARFNTPGTVEARNWSWQAMPDQLTDQVAERFRPAGRGERKINRNVGPAYSWTRVSVWRALQQPKRVTALDGSLFFAPKQSKTARRQAPQRQIYR